MKTIAFFSLLAVLLATTSCSQAAPIATPTQGASMTSTRALYAYHRDDSAPETRIQINAAHLGTTPLNQDVFGNFIEHLGNVIYDILWANALINPNLERSDPKQTMPPFWDQTGKAYWLYGEGGGYLSGRSERLAAPDGMLTQRVFLPVYRVRKYTLTLYARAQNAPGQLRVALHSGDDKAGGGSILRQSVLTIQPGNWQKQTVHWTLPAGALAKGDVARLALSYMGGEAVDVDQVELFPDDAVDGMDPDVLRLARAWHIPILRLAGNASSGYHWRDGVGPRLARPTYHNPAWGGIESNHFGTEEFLDLAKIVGATPQIAANAGNGTPEEAAEWVAYCNAQSQRVPIWEIGNELYGGWQIGHTDAPGYAARFVQFRDAMLKADPRLQIIATGRGEEYHPDGLARGKEWNEDLLRAAVANGGQAPDWLSIHPLVPMPGGLGGLPYAERWESAMAHPYFMDQTLFPTLIAEIQGIEGPNARTRIAPTEWGIIVGGNGWRESPTHDALSGAIYNALALNAFLRNGDWVTLANMTALLHGGCIKKDRGVPYVDPQYYTQKLYADAAPQTPLETSWTGPGRDVPARGFLPAATNVPDIDVFSALSQNRKTLTLFAVNRNLTEARPVHLDVAGFGIGRASATILTATDPQAGNGWDHPDAVVPKPFPLPTTSGQEGLSVSLPPHSLVVFTFAARSKG